MQIGSSHSALGGAAGGGGSGSNGFTKIDGTVLGGTAAYVEWTSIPADYKDLLIIVRARSDSGNQYEGAVIRVGNTAVDTGTNYENWGEYVGTGSAWTGASNDTYFADASAGGASGGAATANYFGSSMRVIQDYASTSIFKASHSIGGALRSGSTIYSHRLAGLWKSTSAIDVVRVLPLVGPNWVAGSSFDLYGIG